MYYLFDHTPVNLILIYLLYNIAIPLPLKVFIMNKSNSQRKVAEKLRLMAFVKLIIWMYANK